MKIAIARLLTASLVLFAAPLHVNGAETMEISAYTYDVAGGTAFASSFILPRHVPYCSTLLPGFTAEFELAYAAWTEEFRQTIDHGRFVMERDGNGRTVESQMRDLEPALEKVEVELKRLPVQEAINRCQLVLKHLATPNSLKGKILKVK